MPLGRIGFYKNKHNFGTGQPFTPTFAVTESYSGETVYTSYSTTNLGDFGTIVYSVTSNLPNTTIKYQIEDLTAGNTLVSGDFSDNLLEETLVTDANGNATVTKTITDTTGTGHKEFRLNITNPDGNRTFATSSNTYLYEMLPITISGGDTTVTNNVTILDDTGGANSFILGSSRSHRFTTTGNANLTITNYGNYDGNANLWEHQYDVKSDYGNISFRNKNSYWGGGLALKGLAIAGGGGGNLLGSPSGGGGAGEFALLEYNFSDVSPGVYTMTTGPGGNASTSGSVRQFTISGGAISWTVTDSEKSVMFAGNSTLSRTVTGGGMAVGTRANAAIGGSGGGSNSVSRAFAVSNFVLQGSVYYQGISDLIDWANSNYSTPLANVKTFINTDESYSFGNDGGTGNVSAGGGGGSPHPFTGTPGASSTGGEGLKVFLNKDPSLSMPQGNISWYSTPLLEEGNSNIFLAGGGGGTIGNGGDGSTNFGGGGTHANGQDGIVAIAYPYKPAYRFINSSDLL